MVNKMRLVDGVDDESRSRATRVAVVLVQMGGHQRLVPVPWDGGDACNQFDQGVELDTAAALPFQAANLP
ncbi:hypothetical protein RJ55_03183 [Drechmeria coniospora]|nr:hypothetical protein RJ55_03183 [Drechmeria coniospora]